jgi:hypothetical protein
VFPGFAGAEEKTEDLSYTSEETFARVNVLVAI